jgi:hypothetical protein
VLSYLLIVSRLSCYHRHSQPSKSRLIISFANPHPLTLLESYRFKNMVGRGHSLRSDLRKFRRANVPHSPKPLPYLVTSLSPCFLLLKPFPYLVTSLLPCFLLLKSFSCNTYESPRKCCKQKTYGLAKPFRCNTYKKHGGGDAPVPHIPSNSHSGTHPFLYILFSFQPLAGTPFCNPFLFKFMHGMGWVYPPLFRPPSPRRRQASTHLRAIIGPAASASAKKASQE